MATNPDHIVILPGGEIVSMRQLIVDAMDAEELFSLDDLEAYAATHKFRLHNDKERDDE